MQEHVDQNMADPNISSHKESSGTQLHIGDSGKTAVPSVKPFNLTKFLMGTIAAATLLMGVSMFVPNNPQVSKDVLTLATALVGFAGGVGTAIYRSQARARYLKQFVPTRNYCAKNLNNLAIVN